MLAIPGALSLYAMLHAACNEVQLAMMSSCSVRWHAQALWLDGLVGLGDSVSGKERGELLEVARERELRLRTDTLEVLLAHIGQAQALEGGARM